ncbi:alpha/beta fold hydrolase [Modicisalibacter luteus]|uniref:alpha/beta fold hydrolase n=1 Tax=Modicisalibacter luteus TaxID=453962 RepID=UPI00039E7791|nr:alpha/beta hydrolase [Halomonas lutea]
MPVSALASSVNPDGVFSLFHQFLKPLFIQTRHLCSIVFVISALSSQWYPPTGAVSLTTFTTSDNVTLLYKDWGSGQPVFFSHGWPLSSDAWNNQMLFFGQQGYRVISHDRRGHGRSEQTWDGNNMDRYADDLAELFEHLDIRNIIMIGHSTGGGEVAHYIGRHGSARVAKVVLVGAVPPSVLKTDKKPDGSQLRSSTEFVRLLPRTASAELASALVNGSILKVYPGGSHGLAHIDADQFNVDVLAFIRS